MRFLSFVAALAVGGGAAMAQDIDVGAHITSGQVVTWAADHGTASYLFPERVFEGELNLVGTSVGGDEPGYFFLPNSEFAGAHIGFNVRRAVRQWDVPSQNFNAISPLTITIGDAILGTVTTPVTDPPAPIPGLSILVPAAGVDFHFPMELNGSTQGIYLLELEMFTDVPGAATSLPYWAVLNYNLDPMEHEAAIEWVNQNLVPAPGSLVSLSLLIPFVRRRRTTPAAC